MNIRQKCPCGTELELGHVSSLPSKDDTPSQLDQCLDLARRWADEHEPHRQAAIETHLENLAGRTGPTIHYHSLPPPPGQLAEVAQSLRRAIEHEPREEAWTRPFTEETDSDGNPPDGCTGTEWLASGMCDDGGPGGRCPVHSEPEECCTGSFRTPPAPWLPIGMCDKGGLGGECPVHGQPATDA